MQDELSVPRQEGSVEGNESVDEHPAGEIKFSFLSQVRRRSGLLTGLMLSAPAIVSILDAGNTGHSGA